MCRIAAYAGPSAPLSTLLFDGEHSLEHQSFAPRELLFGSLNVDGTGIAWWETGNLEPLRYVSDRPTWSDPNLADLSRRISSPLHLAAVRNATPGYPYGAANVAPYIAGNVAGVHNGWIGGFQGPLGRELVNSLSDESFANLHTINDSKVLILLVAEKVAAGFDLAGALGSVVAEVGDLVRKADQPATLNIAVADGESIAVVRHGIGGPANSLYVLEGSDSVIVASEPHDSDTDWKSVPEDHLVYCTAQAISILPLEETQ